MIRLFVALILLLQVSPDDPLMRAEAAYHAGNYAEAAQIYETVIANGNISAHLYYNLGSAYFEAGDLGRALLNFRRAARLNPRDMEIHEGIALVRALRVDVLGDETALIDNIAAATSGLLTTGELAALTFGVWVAWFGVLLAGIVRRYRVRVPLIVTGLALVLALVLLFGRMYVEANRPAAVVTAFTVEAMSGPGEDYVPLYLLYSGADVRVLAREGDWVRFVLPDDRQGWIPAVSVEGV